MHKGDRVRVIRDSLVELFFNTTEASVHVGMTGVLTTDYLPKYGGYLMRPDDTVTFGDEPLPFEPDELEVL
jgi:hypothetical protein